MSFTSTIHTSREWRLIEDGDLAVATVEALEGRPDNVRVEFLHFDEDRPYVREWTESTVREAQEWAAGRST